MFCFCLFGWILFIGVPVSSRVSAKIQQLVNTLKQPRRPPLREFFVDDFEELLEGECLTHHHSFRGFFLSYSYKQTHTHNDAWFVNKAFFWIGCIESINQITYSKSANWKHCNEHQHLIKYVLTETPVMSDDSNELKDSLFIKPILLKYEWFFAS